MPSSRCPVPKIVMQASAAGDDMPRFFYGTAFFIQELGYVQEGRRLKTMARHLAGEPMTRAYAARDLGRGITALKLLPTKGREARVKPNHLPPKAKKPPGPTAPVDDEDKALAAAARKAMGRVG